MTVPPGIGGRETEEDLMEDLGGPHAEHTMPHDDEAGSVWGDNEAHAAGTVCARCGAVITPGQEVRHRADGQWVHEICPLPA